MKIKTFTLCALAALTAMQANAQRPPVQDEYEIKVLISEMTGGMGTAFNFKTHQKDKGLYLKMRTANYFEGHCLGDGTFRGKPWVKSKGLRYIYVEGSDAQLAGLVPMFGKILNEQKYVTLKYKPVECQPNGEDQGVLFKSFVVEKQDN